MLRVDHLLRLLCSLFWFLKFCNILSKQEIGTFWVRYCVEVYRAEVVGSGAAGLRISFEIGIRAARIRCRVYMKHSLNA